MNQLSIQGSLLRAQINGQFFVAPLTRSASPPAPGRSRLAYAGPSSTGEPILFFRPASIHSTTPLPTPQAITSPRDASSGFVITSRRRPNACGFATFGNLPAIVNAINSSPVWLPGNYGTFQDIEVENDETTQHLR